VTLSESEDRAAVNVLVGSDEPGTSIPRDALRIHILSLVGAGAFLVYEATKNWFYLDEWDFLAYRGVRLGKQGLFYPHNEHWVTIPLLIWRAIFNLVGVRDYWLYALPLIVAHLAVVHLLWRLMLRHNVEPWTATLLAGAFAILGVGFGDLTRAFQLAFVGSLLFGLLAIAAVENDRLWLAPLWAICGLMCSNLGVPMVLTCTLVALVRRRPRMAIAVTVPPALVFLVWYVSIGHAGSSSATDFTGLSFSGLCSYVWAGLTASFAGFVDAPRAVGAVLVIVLAIAVVARRNVPGALALATVPLYGFIGLGRLALGANQATTSRYSYLTVALCLPLIAQCVSILARGRILKPLVASLLVALVGLNAFVFYNQAKSVTTQDSSERAMIEAAAYLIKRGDRFPGQIPSSSTFGPPDTPTMTALTRLVRQGEFPVPPHVVTSTLRAEETILGVFVSPRPGYPGDLTFYPQSTTRCMTVSSKKVARVKLTASGSLRLATRPQSGSTMQVGFQHFRARPSIFVVVPVGRADKWLNIPAGSYPTAAITASDAIRLCESSIRTGSGDDKGL
jgi:hypothetical protein